VGLAERRRWRIWFSLDRKALSTIVGMYGPPHPEDLPVGLVSQNRTSEVWEFSHRGVMWWKNMLRNTEWILGSHALNHLDNDLV